MKIHRNLNNAKRGGPQWVESFPAKETKARKAQGLTGRRYIEAICLENMHTHIQPGTRKMCEAKQARWVCAFFVGTECPIPDNFDGWAVLSFDPRKDSGFMADGQPFTKCDKAAMLADGRTYILNPN